MSTSKYIVIACEVFRPELELLAQKMQTPPIIKFLEQGLHDTPDNLRSEVQRLINETESEYQPSRIVLAYGLCGRGITEVTTKKARLIIPKVHDCIPVLLGSGIDKEVRQEEFSKTYWLSAGWIKYSELDFIIKREARYKKYIEDYGQDSADYLMEVEQGWKNDYTAATMIKWEELYNEQLVKDGKYIANDMQLPYQEINAKTWFVQEILEGGENTEHFFHLNPGETIDINEHGMIAQRPITQII